jgi:hypothetical protein
MYNTRRGLKKLRPTIIEEGPGDWCYSSGSLSSDEELGSDDSLNDFIVTDDDEKTIRETFRRARKYGLGSDYSSSSSEEDDDDTRAVSLEAKIFQSDMPENFKQWARDQIKNYGHDDTAKSKVQFVLGFPWNKLTTMPINLESSKKDTRVFWQDVHKLMTDNISYMRAACEQLINIVARTVAKPDSPKKPILITGVPGCGKTRLLNKVFGPVLSVPVEYINVAGYMRENLSGPSGRYPKPSYRL